MENESYVLISGGSKGIGAACVQAFLEKGRKVIILSRSIGAWEGNNNILHFSVDLGNINDVKKLCEEKLSKLNIDILVNNSGGPQSNDLENFDAEDFISGMTPHLFASQELLKAVLPSMKKNNFGRIINIISVTANIPLPRMGVSNAIRGAMINWAKTASKELGKYKITVNNVLPGYTKTERLIEVAQSAAKAQGITQEEYEKNLLTQVPIGRFADPSEVAYAVMCFASKKASFITGTSLSVDGGWTTSI